MKALKQSSMSPNNMMLIECVFCRALLEGCARSSGTNLSSLSKLLSNHICVYSIQPGRDKSQYLLNLILYLHVASSWHHHISTPLKIHLASGNRETELVSRNSFTLPTKTLLTYRNCVQQQQQLKIAPLITVHHVRYTCAVTDWHHCFIFDCQKQYVYSHCYTFPLPL